MRVVIFADAPEALSEVLRPVHVGLLRVAQRFQLRDGDRYELVERRVAFFGPESRVADEEEDGLPVFFLSFCELEHGASEPS